MVYNTKLIRSHAPVRHDTRAQMESINECFLLEKELRGVVQKGMRGNVGAVEYLEEVGTWFERRKHEKKTTSDESSAHTEDGRTSSSTRREPERTRVYFCVQPGEKD